MNKFERGLALMDKVIETKDDADAMHEHFGQLLLLIDEEFTAPDQALKPTLFALLDGSPSETDVRTLPPTFDETLWPMLVVKVLLRDYGVGASPRKIPHFLSFVKRYGNIILG
jgi:hypothetical protein